MIIWNSVKMRIYYPTLLFILALSYQQTSALNPYEYHDYCIVGAGPAGLQLAYFLHQSKRDYIVFERNSHAGSFYSVYPRHRQLISLNKRNTGERNYKFNLRHDWNSLLSDDEQLRFTHRSKQLFPSANLLVEYLNDFQRRFNLNVRFNTTISNLRPIRKSSESCTIEACHAASLSEQSFEPRFQMNDQHQRQYTCGITIAATGLFVPHVPAMVGIEWAQGYENVSINVDDFENKTVLILGRGNAAFEVAKHIYDATSYIHLVSRSRVRNSFATHYVGDLRTLNNQLLDTYQLKSLDALVEVDLMEHELHRRAEDGRFQLIRKYPNTMAATQERQEATAYDQVIRCLGFKFDTSIWHPDLQLQKNPGRTMKFPKINYDYQSVDVDHLYFAGVATHSLDFRKSSGGFIHGFRYTARALHRILEYRYHQQKWPSTVLPWHALTNYLIKRINEADGNYQMFGQLVDVILIDKEHRQCRYLEEYPTRLLPRLEEITGFSSTHLLVLNMQYGMNYSGPGRDVFAFDRVSASVNTADRSNFLHPVLYYYADAPLKENDFINVQNGLLPISPSVRVHHIIENLLTSWTDPDEHLLPLRVFLENILRSNFQQKTLKSYVREKFLYRQVTIPVRFYASS